MGSKNWFSKIGAAIEADDCCATPQSKALKVAVIGSGGAAFAAAIRLQEEGAEVAMVERGTTGGTCVNIGCVPSKILISAAHVAHVRTSSPFDGGISAARPSVNRPALQAQQQARVEELRKGKYESILEHSSNIRLIHGEARFADDQTLQVNDGNGREQSLQFDRVLIATGASPAIPPVPGLSDTPYWTSTEALAAQELPDHLIVYGGSYIALELAQAFLRLRRQGTDILRAHVLSRHDHEIGETIQKILIEEGMHILAGQQIRRVDHDGHFFTVDTGVERIS